MRMNGNEVQLEVYARGIRWHWHHNQHNSQWHARLMSPQQTWPSVEDVINSLPVSFVQKKQTIFSKLKIHHQQLLLLIPPSFPYPYNLHAQWLQQPCESTSLSIWAARWWWHNLQLIRRTCHQDSDPFFLHGLHYRMDMLENVLEKEPMWVEPRIRSGTPKE